MRNTPLTFRALGAGLLGLSLAYAAPAPRPAITGTFFLDVSVESEHQLYSIMMASRGIANIRVAVAPEAVAKYQKIVNSESRLKGVLVVDRTKLSQAPTNQFPSALFTAGSLQRFYPKRVSATNIEKIIDTYRLTEVLPAT